MCATHSVKIPNIKLKLEIAIPKVVNFYLLLLRPGPLTTTDRLRVCSWLNRTGGGGNWKFLYMTKTNRQTRHDKNRPTYNDGKKSATMIRKLPIIPSSFFRRVVSGRCTAASCLPWWAWFRTPASASTASRASNSSAWSTCQPGCVANVIGIQVSYLTCCIQYILETCPILEGRTGDLPDVLKKYKL